MRSERGRDCGHYLMRNSMGEELTRENDTESRWKEHFVQSGGFSSASLFPGRKREAVTQGGTRGIVKGWENKHSRYIHVKQE